MVVAATGISDPRCAAYGGPPQTGGAFHCADCGRPLATCADPGCGWCVRLSVLTIRQTAMAAAGRGKIPKKTRGFQRHPEPMLECFEKHMS
jgi:hypothetical protein